MHDNADVCKLVLHACKASVYLQIRDSERALQRPCCTSARQRMPLGGTALVDPARLGDTALVDPARLGGVSPPVGACVFTPGAARAAPIPPSRMRALASPAPLSSRPGAVTPRGAPPCEHMGPAQVDEERRAEYPAVGADDLAARIPALRVRADAFGANACGLRARRGARWRLRSSRSGGEWTEPGPAPGAASAGADWRGSSQAAAGAAVRAAAPPWRARAQATVAATASRSGVGVAANRRRNWVSSRMKGVRHW